MSERTEKYDNNRKTRHHKKSGQKLKKHPAKLNRI
jgi:hypothetical protein